MGVFGYPRCLTAMVLVRFNIFVYKGTHLYAVFYRIWDIYFYSAFKCRFATLYTCQNHKIVIASVQLRQLGQKERLVYWQGGKTFQDIIPSRWCHPDEEVSNIYICVSKQSSECFREHSDHTLPGSLVVLFTLEKYAYKINRQQQLRFTPCRRR